MLDKVGYLKCTQAQESTPVQGVMGANLILKLYHFVKLDFLFAWNKTDLAA